MRGRLRRDDRGVSAVELAVIAPSLVLLIFFVIEAALYFYARSVALQAAREGVSQLRLQQSSDACQALVPSVDTHVETFAQQVAGGLLHGPAATASCQPHQVTVTVKGSSLNLIGISFSVSESATGQLEQFQPAP